MSPKCPKCNSGMSLREAKKGKFAGKKFWGCDNFPKCRGIVNYDNDVTNKKNNSSSNFSNNSDSYVKSKVKSIVWKDYKSRSAWLSEYTSIGSLPSFASYYFEEEELELKKTISQTLLLYKKDRKRNSEPDSDFLCSILIKFLQRGLLPLCTAKTEKSIIEKYGLDNSLQKNTNDDGDLSYSLTSRHINLKLKNAIINQFNNKIDFKLDSEFKFNTNTDTSLFDSEIEQKFINELIPNYFGKDAAHWFLPQVNLDDLLSSHSFENPGKRRIDFLFCHPSIKPIAIEIDGSEHKDKPEIDKQRDELLKSCDIETIRIPNREIENGKGDNLDKLTSSCDEIFNKEYKIDEETAILAKSIKEITLLSKLQYSIVKAIKFGWLNHNEDWIINIKGLDNSSISAIKDILEILESLNTIYDIKFYPKNLVIENDSGLFFYDLSSKKEIKIKKNKLEVSASSIAITIEDNSSIFNEITLSKNQEQPDIIIRNIYLPSLLSSENIYSAERKIVQDNKIKEKISSLDIFLQNVFRKKTFRPMQASSIINSLRNIDSVVLLPTGAGKSFIYQLAGLLMPGITIVVDPIISLIEDQVEGLLSYGIDRAVPIVSGADDLDNYLTGIERGEYLFIFHSPERLQNPLFREKLRGLSQSSIINLAVIDEAHCVSEWGHDFRPAYLNLSRNIKEFGRDRFGKPPSIIALTGTASRAVLRDVLADLEIDKSKSESVVRPDSFDRKELKFFISRSEQVEFAETTFKGALNSLPDKFNISKNDFFNPSGKDTYSGIIFVPFAGGYGEFSYGVMGTKNAFENATRTNATYFSGKNPIKKSTENWELKKRLNVKQFKRNDIPVLIATKAFGMGIDKPNIRYTLHLGIPGSIESFYQEAGRAGRDRNDAYCGIVFSEYDKERTNSLLDPSISLEDLKIRFQTAGKKVHERDDVTRQLFFHTSSFSGQKEELDLIRETLDSLNNINIAQTVEINFSGNDDKKQEKSIYRLTKIGIFKDYEVNYGSQTFKIYINNFDLDQCKNNLIDYVSSSQPGRVKSFQNELDLINGTNSKQNAFLLAKSLIDFTYDVIERSRRRAIFETVLLARNSTNDNSIRKRLLDYLQEGVSTELLNELLEKNNIEFEDWFEILEKIDSAIDAGEFRGMAIRGLESFPDHPGLLFMRSITEIFCSDFDEIISLQALYSSIESSQNKYDVNSQEWLKAVKWLIDFATTKNDKIHTIMTLAFYQALQQKILSKEVADYFNNLLNNSKNKNIVAMKDVFDTINFTKKAELSISKIKETMSDSKISKLLERV